MAQKSLKVNAILNVIKQCCNILFPLITYPYVTTVLGEANIGRFSFADSIVQYFIIFATLGAGGYAIREGSRIRNDKEKIVQFSSEIFSINLISLLISYSVLIACVCLVDRINQDAIYVVILSANVVMSVLGRDWINSIYEEFSYITVRYILCQFISIIFLFVFVKTPSDCVTYTCITLIATAGAQLANMFYTVKKVPLKVHFSKRLMVHIKPIVYMCAISVASIIYINSDITILGFFRSEEEVGVYYISSKVYSIVKALINAIVMTITPRIAFCLGENNMEEYNTILGKTKKVLLTVVVPCVVGLFFMSENVLEIIGLHDLTNGSISLRILCLAILVSTFAYYYSQAILIPNKHEKVFFIATILSAIVNIGLNFFLIPIMGIIGASITTLIAELIVVYICKKRADYLYKKTNNKELISIFYGGIVIIVTCLFIKLFKLNLMMETFLSISFSVIGYFVILIILKNEVVYPVYINILKRCSGKGKSTDD